MSANTDVLRDITASDLLNSTRLLIQQQLSLNTSQTVYTPDYIVPTNDSGTVTDSVVKTSQNTGTFLVGTATIGFSDAG